MRLSEALGVLAKSSPFSVATKSDRPKDEFDRLKDHLYIEQKIENEFRTLLEKSRSSQILFLCGSSGDGKSEILTRAYREFRDRVTFHLDATHGFEPRQTAVEALDEVFDRHLQSDLPLAVGINLGMMSNYAAGGAERHQSIKAAIKNFVTEGKRDRSGDYIFLDFESFPKFVFDEQEIWKATFSSALMSRLTDPITENPFWMLSQQNPSSEDEIRIAKNFALFSRPVVQHYINKLLFRARLEFDQFMTARALLDFIYHIVIGPGSLVDNLFSKADNDLADKVAAFDPAECHSKKLDLFSVTSRLRPYGNELKNFIETARDFGLYVRSGTEPSPTTLLRFFAICREVDLGNNFHQQFRVDFDRDHGAFDKYARIWLLHSSEDKFTANKSELIKFYMQDFIPAILTYANRRSPWLSKSQFYLQELNGIVVSANFRLKQPSRPMRFRLNKTTWFTATVSAEGQPVELQVSLPLFNLLSEILRGYRPTRYDKNTTVMLDDFIARLSQLATASSKLVFSGPDSRTIEIERLDEDIFQMETL